MEQLSLGWGNCQELFTRDKPLTGSISKPTNVFLVLDMLGIEARTLAVFVAHQVVVDVLLVGVVHGWLSSG
jgi:hypothetical protein